MPQAQRNTRQHGTHPRALGTNPRARRAWRPPETFPTITADRLAHPVWLHTYFVHAVRRGMLPPGEDSERYIIAAALMARRQRFLGTPGLKPAWAFWRLLLTFQGQGYDGVEALAWHLAGAFLRERDRLREWERRHAPPQ